ncbi:DUF92 domain-containing protein [Alloacidobacterium dinghuense]|uniref:DUF92 domain-containing protein n=1 Tax=Alloacidobacterium dinghuense TaxID=2763107 RepID=A0A7G8BKN3_9BACT|nr:DUF92 domain-containing protein [Alloacidobacterium dinghuense]QNI33103.1 DUF92 domain-containing protein [Alloacidobacterium dinghuense]
MHQRNHSGPSLHWQSQLLLLIVVPACSIWIFIRVANAWAFHDPVLLQMAAISIVFGLVVWVARAATGYAAATGAIITACLYLRLPGWRTPIIPLIVMLILTLTATRIGRARKEQLGTAEARHGRNAAQVAANLGGAALAAIPLTATQLFAPSSRTAIASLAAISAALAEAAADTLSSELGQVFGGQPLLITTLKPVPVGTDGGVTLAGTAIGCIGAAIVTAVAAMTFRLNVSQGAVIFSSAILGLFADSLFGAVFERRGWLNNDAVNFLSTLVAAIAAGWIVSRHFFE